MKNRRTITVAVLGAALAFLALAGILRWYRAGELPAGPGSFFNPRERERSLARLAAHRLDLRPAGRLCEDVDDHLRQAAQVRFANPEAAADILRPLAADLERLAAVHQETIDRMEAGNPGTWRDPFGQFLDAAGGHYADALALCRILSRQDWSDAGFPTLLEHILAAKEATARLQTDPIFPAAIELRNTLYPAFEQAYSDRNESDPARLRRRLLRPQPALTRWFYARLLQSRHALPTDLCPEDLYASRDDLLRLQEELTAADIQGVLAAWTFPRGRAAHIRDVATLTVPLAQAASMRDWVRMISDEGAAWQTLIDATAPDEEAPDPELRAAAQWMLDTSRILGERLDELREYPTLTGTAVVVTALQEAARSHRELLDCPAQVLDLMQQRQYGLAQATERLLVLPVGSATTTVTAVVQFRDAATATAATLGEPIADRLVRDGLDHWFVRQWPEVRRLNQLADSIRTLERLGIITRPALLDAAQLLEDIARSQTDAQRQRLLATWRNGLASALTEFPLTARQIERGLESLEQVTLREDLRDAIRLREDRRVRAISDRILAADDIAGDLRATALTCRAILDLPQRIHELDLDRPDRNQTILPPPPQPESVVYPLYQDRVTPVLDLAGGIRRMTAGDCIGALATAVSSLERVHALYPHWRAWDPLLEEAAATALLTCVSTDADALRSLAASVAGLATHFPSLAKWSQYLDTLLALVETDPGAGLLLQRVEAVEAYGEHTPATSNFLAACRSIAYFQDASTAVASFQRIRREVSALRDIPRVPALSGYVADLHRRYTDGIERLDPVVRMDMGIIRGVDVAASTQLMDLSERYALAASDPALPTPLQAYAATQGAALQHYTATNQFTVGPTPPGKSPRKPVRIRYAVLSPGFQGLGHGLRNQGKGSDLVLWLRTVGQTIPLLSADWKEYPADGTIELTGITFRTSAFTWQWGYPVDIGITVAHTRNDNRDLVPDNSGKRSRLNPFNYGVYRVETNHYPIATFPNLEALARDLGLGPAADDSAGVQFDRLLDPELAAEIPPRLVFQLGGLPPGRDFDWPRFLPPANPADARALGEDLRRAATNLFESMTGAISQ